MRKKPVVIVLGILGQSPYAGVAWQVLHYLEGFRQLGYDVFYLEDTGSWPYDAELRTVCDDCRYTLKYIDRLMTWSGLADRWGYRSGVNGHVYGLSDTQLSQVLDQADALVNVTGSTILHDELLNVPVRIYLETDPVLPQIEVAKGHSFTIKALEAHTHYFTFGENIGKDNCAIPTGPFHYHHTRQPVILDWWSSNYCSTSDTDPRSRFTTISSWQQSGKDIEWEGETYLWSKHLELLKFIDLPRQTDQSLELALACEDPEVIQLLKSHGWGVIDAVALSTDIHPYTNYITSSRGEFTVAKDQYVRPRSGWFSDRSACYLAAGRPVITQNTGFDRVLPIGEGLFSFNTLEDILVAFEIINADYERHCRAARDIAKEYFSAEKVLGQLLADIGVS